MKDQICADQLWELSNFFRLRTAKVDEHEEIDHHWNSAYQKNWRIQENEERQQC